MILFRLFFEFCRVGLFSVGGGLATIPFLTDLGNRTGWFGPGDLANMIAISESTPGPMGVNMATYVGFHSAGVLGGVVATLGLVFPSIVIILVIAQFLQKFGRGVLRPAGGFGGFDNRRAPSGGKNRPAPSGDRLGQCLCVLPQLAGAGHRGRRVCLREIHPAEEAPPHLLHCRLGGDRGDFGDVKPRPFH